MKQINPKWQLYVCNYNAAYHDYNISEAEIEQRLGPEPPKFLAEGNMIEQVIALSEQNRKAITCEEAQQVYDLFMAGEVDLFVAWAKTKPEGHTARKVLAAREHTAQMAELNDYEQSLPKEAGVW